MIWLSVFVVAGSAAVGAYVAAERGRHPAEGLMFGVLLGPLGPMVAVLMPEGRRAARARSVEPEESDRIDVSAWDTRQAAGMPRVRV